MTPGTYTVGLDVGGTFTDIAVTSDRNGASWIGKVPSRPHDPQAVVADLAKFLEGCGVPIDDVSKFVHATTLVSNLILERRGARVALVTDAGFADVLDIGRESRYDLFDLALRRPEPLCPPGRRFEVAFRTYADGTRNAPPTDSVLDSLAAQIDGSDADALAVCMLHSYANGAGEQFLTRELTARMPSVPASLSSVVAPVMGEFERFSTTVANAYVQPVMARYLEGLVQSLRQVRFGGQVTMMSSNGGFSSIADAVARPIELVESGAAAGSTYGAALARGHELANALCIDIGGTTAKLSFVDDGEVRLGDRFEVDRISRFVDGSGLPLLIGSVDVLEIGAGGGSVVRVREDGFLEVGPRSVGGFPGPASFDRGGTEATLFDAAVVLGYAVEQVNVERAHDVLRSEVATPLGVTVERAAVGVFEVANERMAAAARRSAAERGIDLRERTLIAYGGGGPLHACSIAAALGIRRVLIGIESAVGSAVGCVIAPERTTAHCTVNLRLGELAEGELTAVVADARRRLDGDRDEPPHLEEKWVFQVKPADGGTSMPFVAQMGDAQPAARLRSDAELSFGRVPLVVEGVGRVLEGPPRALPELATPPPGGPRPRRTAVFASEEPGAGHLTKEATVLARAGLRDGQHGTGPALLEGGGSTAVVPPGWTWRCLASGRIEIERHG